jgi:hypothetical protein
MDSRIENHVLATACGPFREKPEKVKEVVADISKPSGELAV